MMNVYAHVSMYVYAHVYAHVSMYVRVCILLKCYDNVMHCTFADLGSNKVSSFFFLSTSIVDFLSSTTSIN